MTTPEFINRIDWSDLRHQKSTLLKLIEEFDKNPINEITGIAIPDDVVDELTGILFLIDSLQDYAVDELGINEMSVFDFEEEGRGL